MADKTVEELTDELHKMGASIARHVASDSTHRRAAKKHYEAQRRLENAIRRHVTCQCGCRSPRACLSALARLVPVKPRPKYGKRIKAKVTAK